MKMVMGAATSWTRAPASGWPVTWAAEPLIWSLALPSISSVSFTIAGRYDW